MANPTHLEILQQGVESWNKWRDEHLETKPDLSGAMFARRKLIGVKLNNADLSNAKLLSVDLSQAEFINAKLDFADLNNSNLSDAKLSGAGIGFANLSHVNLSRADLNNSNLDAANLSYSNLSGANLRNTSLFLADLTFAKLNDTDFSCADLGGANLWRADLIGANLRGANLNGSNFSYANLNCTDLSGSLLGSTVFAYNDLRDVKGLETVRHHSPSSIGIDTLYRSGGKIPEFFLRGAGVPDEFIEQTRVLFSAEKAIEFYSCFLSYSSRDEAFARRLHARLQQEHVRVWFAPEDLKIGDRFRHRIDETIRVYDKLLLVLSEDSVNSTWVEKEVETALERESEQNRTMLFPIRLDDAVMEIKTGWPADIRRTRYIGDFSKWEEHDAFETAFKRLLRDLQATKETKPTGAN